LTLLNNTKTGHKFKLGVPGKALEPWDKEYLNRCGQTKS